MEYDVGSMMGLAMKHPFFSGKVSYGLQVAGYKRVGV